MSPVAVSLGILGTLIPLSPLSCTTVVVWRTTDTIVLAADSLATVNGKHFATCKIGVNSSPIVFAFAGPVTDNDKFLAYDLANAATLHGSDIRAAAEKLETTIPPLFEKFLTETRKTKPSVYRQIIKPPEPLQAVLATVEGAVPVYIEISFTVKDPQGTVVVTPHEHSCPGDLCQHPILHPRRYLQAGRECPTSRFLDSFRTADHDESTHHS